MKRLVIFASVSPISAFGAVTEGTNLAPIKTEIERILQESNYTGGPVNTDLVSKLKKGKVGQTKNNSAANQLKNCSEIYFRLVIVDASPGASKIRTPFFELFLCATCDFNLFK